MKTKELIRRLQEEDPTGEVECCVGNVDIHFVSSEPAYWDGPLQVLVRDPAKAPYYDIVGAKYVKSGSKIQIHCLSITDAIGNADEHFPVEGGYSKANNATRQSTKDIDRKIHLNFFTEWATKKAETDLEIPMDADVKYDIKRGAETFWDENYPDFAWTYMPEDLRSMRRKEIIQGKEYDVIPSAHERFCLLWDREVKLTWDGFQVQLGVSGKLPRKRDTDICIGV